MENNQSSGVRPKKTGLLVLAAVIVIAVIAITAVIMSGVLKPAGAQDNNKLITKSNELLVLGTEDLGAGWDVTIAYRPDPYQYAPNASEVGVARYTHNISLDPLKVEVITLELFHFNTTDDAKDIFSAYRAQSIHSWQSIDLETIGNVSVGDEAILCSGNWTASHGAIKTLLFRENNIIVLLVCEATENFGLTNDAAIEMAEKQDTKLLI